jgi:hypothetical protein
MPALVAGIHVFKHSIIKDVDGRTKSGHDENQYSYSAASLRIAGTPRAFTTTLIASSTRSLA